jgi:hypothetical protein
VPRFSPEARKANQALVDRLGSIAAALELTPGDLRQIEEALAGIEVQGERYPPHLAARAAR